MVIAATLFLGTGSTALGASTSDTAPNIRPEASLYLQMAEIKQFEKMLFLRERGELSPLNG